MQHFAKILLLSAGSVLLVPAWAMHPLATEDAGTLGAGSWELEVTADHATDSETVDVSLSMLNVTLSRGLTADVDAGISFGAARIKVADSSESGIVDGAVWLKWRFLDAQPVSVAVVPYLTLPLGDEDSGMGSGKVNWGGALILSADLSQTVAAHANLAWDHDNADESGQVDGFKSDTFGLSAAVTAQVSDQWTLAGEVFTVGSNYEGEDDRSFAGVGVIYAPSTAVALSVGYQAGLSDSAMDHTIKAGVTLGF